MNFYKLILNYVSFGLKSCWLPFFSFFWLCGLQSLSFLTRIEPGPSAGKCRVLTTDHQQIPQILLLSIPFRSRPSLVTWLIKILSGPFCLLFQTHHLPVCHLLLLYLQPPEFCVSPNILSLLCSHTQLLFLPLDLCIHCLWSWNLLFPTWCHHWCHRVLRSQPEPHLLREAFLKTKGSSSSLSTPYPVLILRNNYLEFFLAIY